MHVDQLTAVDSELHVPLSDEMGRNDVTRSDEEWFANVRRDLTVDAPRRSELGLEKNTSSQANHTQDI